MVPSECVGVFKYEILSIERQDQHFHSIPFNTIQKNIKLLSSKNTEKIEKFPDRH
jgi:hypothetical protein